MRIWQCNWKEKHCSGNNVLSQEMTLELWGQLLQLCGSHRRNMKTKEIFYLLGFAANHQCRRLMASPYIWDNKLSQLKIEQQSERRWKVVTIFIFFYLLYLLHGFISSVTKLNRVDTAPYGEISFHALYLLTFFILLCEKLNYLQCQHSFIWTVNGFFKYVIEFSGKKYKYPKWT